MAAAKKQFSCRIDEETLERIKSLKERIATATGFSRVSDPEVLRLGMIELEKKYPPPPEPKGKK